MCSASSVEQVKYGSKNAQGMTTYKTPKDVDGGWAWLVLAASYGTLIVVGTSIYMTGILYVAFLDTFNEGAAKTSIIGSLNIGLYALLGPFASSVINTWSCRVSMVVGGVLCTVCYFVSYFLCTIDSIIVVLGVFGGISNSLMCIPAVVILAYYFQERRNLFISLSTVVVGVGMFIASPFGLFLLETYGLRGTLLIMGGLNAQVCVFGMVCRPSSVELSIQKHHKNIRRTDKKFRTCTERLSTLKSVLSIDLLSNFQFLLFLLSTISWSLMLTICLQHLPNYLVDKGATDGDISAVMSTFALSHTLGRLLTTLIVSNGGLDFMTLHVGMCGLIGIVTIAFPFYSDIPDSEYGFAGVVGLYTGGINTLLTPITLSLVDVKKVSAAHGLSFCFSGMGLLLGPYLAGILFESTGSYNSTFITGGSVVMCGCTFGMLAAVKTQNACSEGNQTENMTITVSPNDEVDQSIEIINPDKLGEEHDHEEEFVLI